MKRMSKSRQSILLPKDIFGKASPSGETKKMPKRMAESMGGGNGKAMPQSAALPPPKDVKG